MATTSTYDQQKIPKEFPKNVRAKRKSLSLTQEKLGEITGLHTNYIGGVEQGTRNCTLKSMMSIADGLKTPLPALLDQNFNPEKTNYAIVEVSPKGWKSYDISEKEAKEIINSKTES